MKTHLKFNGINQLTTHGLDTTDLENEISNNKKYIRAGWRTRDEVLALGLQPKDYPERVVVDREAREVILAEGQMVDAELGVTVLERGIERKTEEGVVVSEVERYYIQPQKDHKEFNIPANYTIVQEDETLTQEYKDEQRKNEYNAKGVTTEAMVVALWEKVVENKNDGINALQAKRVEVKVKFPKV